MSVLLFCAEHIGCLLFPQPTCTDQGYIKKKSAKYYVWLFSAVKTWSVFMDFRQGVLCGYVSGMRTYCWIVWVGGLLHRWGLFWYVPRMFGC